MQVLSDPVQRMVYDEIHGYALTAVNPFLDGSIPKDHAFVDEFSCIGMSGQWTSNCYANRFYFFGMPRPRAKLRFYSLSIPMVCKVSIAPLFL